MIIALAGAKGSGKDYFYHKAVDICAVLCERPPIIKKLAFADLIKRRICEIFDLKSEQEYDIFKRTLSAYKTDSNILKLRHNRDIIKNIGMLMRSYDPDQFIKYAETCMIFNMNEPNYIWFITDLRFDNEVQFVRKNYGIIVKIMRHNNPYDGHATEIELPDEQCDHIVINDGTSNFDQTIWTVLNLILPLQFHLTRNSHEET